MIYIVGWLVYIEIILICGFCGLKSFWDFVYFIFGEFFIKKVNEKDMRVLIFVWDDIILRNLFLGLFNNNFGLMGIYDEDIFIYFRGIKVYCFLCFCKFDSRKIMI